MLSNVCRYGANTLLELRAAFVPEQLRVCSVQQTCQQETEQLFTVLCLSQ